MNRYDRSFRGYYGAPPPHGYAPVHRYDRPQVGGYRRYFQGGSGGIPTGPTPPGRYGSGDGWWSGKLGRDRYSSPYERAYEAFDHRHHPRFSPVGGNYHAMGGSYLQGRVPRPLSNARWFSDWTHWF